MARKQSLANKRRSQKSRNKTRNKTRNKKRARTIRSMRQVNGGVGFFNRFFNRLKRQRAQVGDSSLSEPLLSQETPETPETSETILQPLLASTSVTSDEEKIFINNNQYIEQEFDTYLKNSLYFYLSDETLKPFFADKKNEEVVLTPLKIYIHTKVTDNIKIINVKFSPEYINKLKVNELIIYEEFIKLLEDPNVKNSDMLINNIDRLLCQLILYAKTLQITDDKLQIDDKDIDIFIFAATKALNTMFGLDPNIVDPSTESNIEKYLNNIKKAQAEGLTAGGSKGKMSRRNSKTRKM